MNADRADASEIAAATLAARGLDIELSDAIVALVAFVASLGVLAYGLSAGASVPVFLLGHLIVTAILAAYLVLRGRANGDLTIPLLLLIATFAAGPVGALGCALMALALRLRHPSPTRLKDWYEYIAGVVARPPLTRIHDELISDRLPTDHAATVPRFRPILHGGSIEEQQRVLGVIGRRYHPDFRAALRSALRNKNGFIRAQAAAVASRLSIEEKNRLWSAQDGSEPGPDAATDQAPPKPDALDVAAARP